MKFILHIGAHKTGTTTIQEFCALNRDALQSVGLIYPDLRHIEGRERNSHHGLAAAMSSSPRARPQEYEVREFIRELATSCSDHDAALFSAESIWRHVRKPSESGDFWEGHQNYLLALKDLFAPHRTEIVLVLRRQDTFAESLFQENVKMRFYNKSFETFIGAFAHFWAFRRRIEMLREIFDSVTVLPFEAMSRSDLCASFLDAIGVKVFDAHPVPRKNTGLPTQVVLFLQQMNARLDKDAARSLRRHLMNLSVDGAFDFEPIRLFSSDERRSFLDTFADENAWLRENFGVTGASFFPDNIPDMPGRSMLLPDEGIDTTAALLSSVLKKKTPPDQAPAGHWAFLNSLIRRRS